MRLEDLMEAYFLCRRNKRNTEGALDFEVDYEAKLDDLCREINRRKYLLGTSVTFVVPRPVCREVFAPAFRDRIIDTYIAMRTEPMFERTFTPRTFNCRRGKGSLYGVRTLERDVRECSKGYTQDCHIMKLDIRGFFMSISKPLLADRVDAYLEENYTGYDKEDLRYLCRTAIMHRPELDCVRNSPSWMWRRIAPEKSLFTNGADRGVAIGRIIAQIFANFLLDGLDKFVIGQLGFPHYGRYVDDFYIVHESKERLLAAIPEIRRFLKEELELELHPRKVYIQHYTKGVKFTGAVVKPGRTYIGNRTVAGLRRVIRKFNRLPEPDLDTDLDAHLDKVRHCICALNSYYGLLCHAETYAIRRKCAYMLEPHCWKYFYVAGGFRKFVLKKEYTEKYILYEKIRQEKRKRHRSGKTGRKKKAGRHNPLKGCFPPPDPGVVGGL